MRFMAWTCASTCSLGPAGKAQSPASTMLRSNGVKEGPTLLHLGHRHITGTRTQAG